MSAASYPVGTLAQMAAIPEDALPRFLAELPAMLRIVRTAAAMNASVGVILGATAELDGIEWVDDDKQQATFHAECAGRDLGSFSLALGDVA